MGKFERATKDNYTLPEIERALKNTELMYCYAEQGDLEILHLVIDAEKALQLAQPTKIQLNTVDLVYRQGYSLVETGRILGVTPQAVKFNLDLLRVKIKKIVDQWKVLDREGVE